MVRLYIELGDGDWNIYVYYGVERNNASELSDELRRLNCPERYIKKALNVIIGGINSGMTFSNTSLKTSLVLIGLADSSDQFVNTVVHEAKHVQSHVCLYYGVDEDGEQAAYLIGYIVLRMYKMLRRLKHG